MSRYQQCLPEDLVLKIFSTKHKGDDVLTLKDRVRHEFLVRCLAVCKAWRSYLDPRRWPIQACRLEQDTKVADWVCQVQPAVQEMTIWHTFSNNATMENPRAQAYLNALASVRPKAALTELTLAGSSRFVWSSLPLLSPFVSVTYLSLVGNHHRDFPLESQHLTHLPLLAKLEVVHWGQVSLEGTLLPNLQQLELYEASGLRLDAALPRLHTLNVQSVGDVRVRGERLRLPALTELFVNGNFPDIEAEVDMGRLTALQELSLFSSALPWVDGLASLRRLTSLQLECHCHDEQMAAERLLRSAPQSVQRLELEMLRWKHHDLWPSPLDPGLAAALGALTQLTSLVLLASSPVPVQLGPLSRLQTLRLGRRLEKLTCVELGRLQQLRQLQRLVLAARKVQEGEQATALQVLELSLPAGCVVELE